MPSKSAYTKHLKRLAKRNVLADGQGATLPDRFWAKVIKGEDGCWLWTGAVSHGYGVFGVGDRTVRVHRASYEAAFGAIPAGLTIDHLCRRRLCVRPAHLEAVTRGENVLRSEGPTAKNAAKTHCARGHRFTASNTRIEKGGGRHCKSCARQWKRDHADRAAIGWAQYYAANRERINAAKRHKRAFVGKQR